MKQIVYDIECLPNFFCVVFTDLHSDEQHVFQITEEKKEHRKIIQVAQNNTLIGYNSHNYDDVLIKYIISNPYCTNKDLYKISKAIITNKREVYKKYKRDNSVESIDIMTMLASSKLRVSLKHLQVVINWHNVQEFEVDWDSNLPKDQWEPCIEYCINDVLSLKAVCETLKKDFELREFVYETTEIACFSKDPVKIAEYTMAKAIAESKGQNTDSFIWETTDANKPVGKIKVKDLLFPFISFKTERFKEVHKAFMELEFDPAEEQAKKPDDRWGHPMRFDKMWLVFGLGGLHHNYGKKTGNKKFKSKGLIHRDEPGSKLLMPDVSSYYPSMRIQHIPHKFDPAFLNEYKKAYREKAEAKKEGNKMLEGYAKLRLNSVYGLYNSLYSPLYAPKVSYGTAINGQLMLAMLIEAFDEAGINVLGTNTDSITIRLRDDQEEKYKEICSWWEKLTGMKLDHDEFSAIYEQSCNNYIATMPNGYVKTKGSLVPELNLLKGYSHPIVKKAVIKYFTEGVKIEKTIEECDNIYDFCMTSRMGTAKNGNKFEAYHKGEKLQRTNRYYAGVGPDAGYLYKNCGTGDQHVLSDTGVIIFNKYYKKEDYNINYPFYIRAARKIINEIETEQLTLW